MALDGVIDSDTTQTFRLRAGGFGGNCVHSKRLDLELFARVYDLQRLSQETGTSKGDADLGGDIRVRTPVQLALRQLLLKEDSIGSFTLVKFGDEDRAPSCRPLGRALTIMPESSRTA